MKRIQRVFGDIDALRYVDDRLDEERRAAYQAHLASEPDEAARVAVWLRQNDAVRAAFASVAAEPVPVWLRLGNMEDERPMLVEPRDTRAAEPIRIAKLAETAPVAVPGWRGRSVGLGALALVLAGACVIASVAHYMPAAPAISDARFKSGADLDSAFLARAIDAYRTFALDASHPVEIAATQQPALERWLQRRLSVPIKAPDLRAQGWTLLGGRLAPGDFGPAALFVYEDSGTDRMALYVARTGIQADAKAGIEAMSGGSTMTWTAGPIGYVMAAGRDVDWMKRNGESLRASVNRASGE